MKHNFIIFFITIILSILYSCSTTAEIKEVKEETQIEEEKIEIKNELKGRKFKLVSAYPEMNITIEFGENKVYGFSAINNYFSEYLTDGDIFSVKSIATTKKTASKEYREAENKYLNMLRDATSYKLNGNKLTIYTLLSGENLVFEEF